jgi:membrane protein implicated in regulation of membrane protease activity
MSDRAWLFLGSLLMIVLSLAATGWLVATGQAFTLDGLFLIHVFLLTALAFALYLWFMINRAKEEIQKESEPPKAPAKRSPAPASAD